MRSKALVAFVTLGMASGCSAGGGSLVVGDEGTGGVTGVPRGTGGATWIDTDGGIGNPNALSAHIESPRNFTVTVVRLSCSESCADVIAVATGGNAPYDYRWENGSTSPERHVCSEQSTTFTVTVTDTKEKRGEFTTGGETASAMVTAQALACPDDGGTPVPPGAGCDPETLTIDVKGSVRSFANGSALPAGHYRIEYADGCMAYATPGAVGGNWGWTIHAGVLAINPFLSGFPGAGHCVMVGATADDVIDTLPGTEGTPGHATYSECVEENHATVAPVEFDFRGGPLGIVVKDGFPADDVGGETENGVSPTWKLTRLSGCD
jgi:hypothetical protein